jgi:hypothetical protein
MRTPKLSLSMNLPLRLVGTRSTRVPNFLVERWGRGGTRPYQVQAFTARILRRSLTLAAALALACGLFTSCESTDGGSSSASGGVYYGVGIYDPWYYGDAHYDYDIDVTRPDRPDGGAHPEQPIARPPDASSRPPSASTRPAASTNPSVSSRPAPSIPSTPRASPSMGGGGGRGGGGGGGGRR